MPTRSSFARRAVVAAIAVSALAACGSSGGRAAGGGGAVRITNVWARDTAPNQTNDAVYLTIVNGTGRPVTITGVRVPASIAQQAQMHETVTGMPDSGDMTTMSEVPKVSVPAHGSFRFAPGHHHIMLVDLAGPLTARQTFPITLVRGDGTTLQARVTVRGL